MGLLLGACSGDDTHLPALLADPMADYEADGVVLIESREKAERPGFLGGKPRHAEVERLYRISNESRMEKALEEAAGYAEAHGWRFNPRQTTTGYRGAKELPPGDGRLIVSLVARDPLHDPDGQEVLRIKLDFGTVRFDETTTSVVEGG